MSTGRKCPFGGGRFFGDAKSLAGIARVRRPGLRIDASGSSSDSYPLARSAPVRHVPWPCRAASTSSSTTSAEVHPPWDIHLSLSGPVRVGDGRRDGGR